MKYKYVNHKHSLSKFSSEVRASVTRKKEKREEEEERRQEKREKRREEKRREEKRERERERRNLLRPGPTFFKGQQASLPLPLHGRQCRLVLTFQTDPQNNEQFSLSHVEKRSQRQVPKREERGERREEETTRCTAWVSKEPRQE